MVLLIALVLWLIGAAMDAPHRARWVMIAVLFAGVAIVQLALPAGHPLRDATGGDVRLWLMIAVFVGIALAYRAGLTRVRAHVVAREEPVTGASFSATELDRYARHIVLREVGGPGQKALKDARVLVVGAGGLGSPVLLYLAAAGVGTIGVIDDDTVDNSNLQRQVIHRDADIGTAKVRSAAAAMQAQNPNVAVKTYQRRLDDDIAAALIAEYDLVLDGTDNFATRYLVNATCVQAGVPLVAAALTQWEGQISVYDPAKGAPCYRCIFPQAPDPALAPSCAEAGVIGPLPGVLGAMMALEAIKAITGAGETLRGRMMIYDALYGETRTIAMAPRADCPVCGG